MMIRAARVSDLPAVAALMAPEIAADRLLPRVLVASELIVAERDGAIIGVVGLKSWAGGVVELGSLVSAAPGLGLGRALVESAVNQAAALGYHTVVALTGIDEFFLKLGFRPSGAAPWAIASGCGSVGEPKLAEALAHKARICAACPRLAGCSQSLLARDLAVPMRVAA